MRAPLVLGAALALVASGCLESAPPRSIDDASDSPPGSSTTGTPTSEPGGPTTTPPPTNGTPPPGNGSNPPPPPSQPPWPPLSQATIRPGVRVADASCTSNFLFRTPDNVTLLLGTASHCVDGLKLGDPVSVSGASRPGRLAYSAWIALGLQCAGGPTSCTGGQFENDFALIALDPADRGKIHPAVLKFGGPTALADASQLGVGARVLGYGNSGTWGNLEPLKAHEGVVTASPGTAQFRVATAAPGIPGDSGSSILTRDGKAAGVLVTICLAPCTAQNGVVTLKDALALAKQKTGATYDLVTWAQLDDGLLP